MIYRAFLGGREVDEFSLNGQSIDEIRGGKEIFWQRSKIRVRENVANFCGYSKCVSKNGVEVIEAHHKGDPIEANNGTFLELFTGDSPYSKRLIDCKKEEYSTGYYTGAESWGVISYDEYFYAIKYKCENYAAGVYIVTAFYKFDEDGNTVYHFENSEAVPDDSLKGMAGHTHHHYLHAIKGFYVINDVFYIIFDVGSPDVDHVSDAGLKFIVGYQNGIHMSERLVINAEEGAFSIYTSCSCQFMIDNKIIVTASNTDGTYYKNHPLEEATGNTLGAIPSRNYSFLGTDGKKIYMTDVSEDNGRRSKIYLYEDGKCIFKKNMEDEEKESRNYKLIAAAFIGDMMYAAMIYGNLISPHSAIVVEIDTKTFGESKTIYKLNVSTNYAWATIRQITSKNGKLYVHKEYQKLWTDDTSVIGIDEISFPKKKGDTK